jgi:uncharacterized protein (DUF433 family)
MATAMRLNLEGMTADEIEQDYPELDESFGISESMREYEEPEEELTTWLKDGIEQEETVGDYDTGSKTGQTLQGQRSLDTSCRERLMVWC